MANQPDYDNPDGNLTAKQRKFIELYDGDGKASAIASGYSPKTAEQSASRLLRMVKIKQAIMEREQRESKDSVADRRERQEFWTAMMNDSDARMSDRLKASELLGRSQADFIERREVTVDKRYADIERQADELVRLITPGES